MEEIYRASSVESGMELHTVLLIECLVCDRNCFKFLKQMVWFVHHHLPLAMLPCRQSTCHYPLEWSPQFQTCFGQCNTI